MSAILVLLVPGQRDFWKIWKRGIGMKKALITGVTGQDGSYLAEFLLEKGYVMCMA